MCCLNYPTTEVLIVTPSQHLRARPKMLICSSWQYIFLASFLLPEHTLKAIVFLWLLKTTTLLIFIKPMRATLVTRVKV